MARRYTALYPSADGTLTKRAKPRAFAALVNDPSQDEARAVTEGPNPSRLLYTTAPLARDTRVSGTTRVRLDVTSTVPTGQVGVFLVDYGPAERVLATGDGARTLSTESCYGKSVTYDDACYFDVERRLGVTPLQTLARGWARLDGAGRHRVTVELTPQDDVVLSGHRLGVVIVAASDDWVVTVDDTPSTYTVSLHRTRLALPGQVRFDASAPHALTRSAAIPALDALPRGTVPVLRGGPQLPW